MKAATRARIATARQERERDEVRKPIEAFLAYRGWRVTHADVVRAHSSRGYVRLGTAGQPDLWCVHGEHGGLLVETKAPKGRLSEVQREWHLAAEKDGIDVVVASSFEEFEAEYGRRYGRG